MRSRIREEGGLVGKVLVLFLALAVVAVVAAVDAGSIVLSTVRVGDLATDAASSAAARYADTGTRRAAVRAALATITDRDDDARLGSLRLEPDGGVTVSVTDRAGTILVGRFGLLEDVATITAARTSNAPS